MKRLSIYLLMMLSLIGSQAFAVEIQPLNNPSLHNPYPKTSAVQRDWPELMPEQGINSKHWDEQHMAAEHQRWPQEPVPHFSGRIEGWR
ncbi:MULTISPECIES: hypothetical protein [Buttiauxella]|uniref:hypothetical protein n=1 Tax=Buttiauxella TaxID=82976 RepID=UPI00125F0D7D|nr:MULTISPECIES: hypothetical protein [Buttiauxella]MCE0812648.1 hypothetical protein [Buttiauxella sp. S04-F03]